ncbi:hypothetical protein [uncultured Winogradskyella sp.]|uniref:hypothetical protein n=1 Tax=uncultured Winogradskyella sp. TaxID=395353 RepID=UPI0030D82FCE
MKMKLSLLLLIMSLSCTQKADVLLGTWRVQSPFYKATCKILEENDSIKGLVLYYNDDTTVYSYKEGEAKNYFFNNLKEKGGQYIDAISGATKTKSSNEKATLNLLSKDTLEITTYIMHKPLKEIWVRF